MGLQTNIIPMDSLANLNEHNEMTKLILGPLLVLAGVVAVIALVRFIQRLRDRRLVERYRD